MAIDDYHRRLFLFSFLLRVIFHQHDRYVVLDAIYMSAFLAGECILIGAVIQIAATLRLGATKNVE